MVFIITGLLHFLLYTSAHYNFITFIYIIFSDIYIYIYYIKPYPVFQWDKYYNLYYSIYFNLE